MGLGARGEGVGKQTDGAASRGLVENGSFILHTPHASGDLSRIY